MTRWNEKKDAQLHLSRATDGEVEEEEVQQINTLPSKTARARFAIFAFGCIHFNDSNYFIFLFFIIITIFPYFSVVDSVCPSVLSSILLVECIW